MKKNLLFITVLLAVAISFSHCHKSDNVQKATIAGQIINSQTGLGLANATVSFCKPFTHGLKSTTADPEVVFFVTTDASGNYSSTEAIVGTYTIMIVAANYFTQYVDNFVIVFGVTNSFAPVTLAQTLGSSVLRVVLTWGVTPSDLDSHLTGPIASSSSRFHVYWSADQYPTSGTPIIILDVDNTHSYGPETVTINSLTTGLYRYSVHNYSDQTTSGGQGIASSPANVKVYGPSGLIKSYNAPAFSSGGGNTWVVFELNATSTTAFTITDKNTWTQAASTGSVTKK
jgi:hypothetical protein